LITWLLDLDNTLHDAGADIMPRINRDMTAYVARTLDLPSDEASALRVQYWRRYGATLLGMIRHHAVDPHDFLRETHRFPDLYDLVRRQHALIALLRRLPGRKVLLTNAPRVYAHGVLKQLGIARVLDRVICIEDMRFAGHWQPKPSVAMLRRLAAKLRVDPHECVLVEDSVENLVAARRCGMQTVWVQGLHRRTLARATKAKQAYVPKPRLRRHPAIDFQIQSVLTLARIAINKYT
jgi:putative hydrolase of the HAD superfamily